MSYHPDDIARHTIRSHDPQVEPEFCRPEPDDDDMTMKNNAMVCRTEEFDPFTRVARNRWRADLHGGSFDGRRRLFATRREAIEWCAEFGYEVTA